MSVKPSQQTNNGVGAQQQPPADSSIDPKSNLPAARHQRTYQACIPCRCRKVKCDLGSVDDPREPPCHRCRRESKDCFFSATRRKRKGHNDGSDSELDELENTTKNARKRTRTSSSIQLEGDEQEEQESDEPRTPGGSKGRPHPLPRPPAARPVIYGEEDHMASDKAAGVLQHRELHCGHDALRVLSDLASSAASHRQGSNPSRPTSLHVSADTSPIKPRAGFASDLKSRQETRDVGVTILASAETEAYALALRAWTRFRFVRAGWFTAKEAIDYVSYFYKYLAPLTPVVVPDFRAPSEHERMLTQEPMLTVTILLIASRHMKLDGPGNLTRPHAIHDKLWNYMSGMLDRVIWGQEQSGGGFCQAGSEPAVDVNPLSRKGLRTLGTVESLVLLTEWHPRAMHFPPVENDDELMIPDERVSTPDFPDNDPSKGSSGQRMDAWLEPCWRSDRMCWMLLGISMSLAFEIGVFDSSDSQRHAKSSDDKPLSAEDLRKYDGRRSNVRDLLLVYVSQTSGRMGLTSMLPGNYSKPEDSRLFKAEIGQHQGIKETVLHFWLRMAAIMREVNQKVFANKPFTRDLIRNGNYHATLQQLQGPLDDWRRDFDRCASIPKYMQLILEIEYEYCRVYLFALPLQAVAYRCANELGSSLEVLEHPLESAARHSVKSDPPTIAPETLAKHFGGDRKYMVLVGDSARKLLKIVVDGLAPGDYLKHAPVRTYFRIISVAIMLYKSFSLGATENDVAESLTLLDRTVEALRTSVVDDVHVASRFADLLDSLTQSLKPRLVRMGRGRLMGQNGPHPTTLASTGGPSQSAYTQYPQQQAGAPSAQAAWQYTQHLHNNMVHTANDAKLHTANDANLHSLYGISNELYNVSNPHGQYTVMPPPNFGFASSPNFRATHSMTSPHVNDNAGYYDYNNADPFANYPPQDWLALPLDPLINYTGGVDVNSTMYGPELGGQDMLDLLLGHGNSGFGGN